MCDYACPFPGCYIIPCSMGRLWCGMGHVGAIQEPGQLQRHDPNLSDGSEKKKKKGKLALNLYIVHYTLDKELRYINVRLKGCNLR